MSGSLSSTAGTRTVRKTSDRLRSFPERMIRPSANSRRSRGGARRRGHICDARARGQGHSRQTPERILSPRRGPGSGRWPPLPAAQRLVPQGVGMGDSCPVQSPDGGGPGRGSQSVLGDRGSAGPASPVWGVSGAQARGGRDTGVDQQLRLSWNVRSALAPVVSPVWTCTTLGATCPP